MRDSKKLNTLQNSRIMMANGTESIDLITFRIIISFCILVIGFALAKIAEKIVLFFLRKRFKVRLKKPMAAKIIYYGTIMLFIIFALGILQIDVSRDFFLEFYRFVPSIISIVLLFITATMIIRLIFFIIDSFIKKSGLYSLIEDYGKAQIMKILIVIFKAVLYIISALIILNIAGINIKGATALLGYVSYTIMVMLLLFLFFSMKDIIKNMLTGYYIKYANMVRIGEYIKIRSESKKSLKISRFTSLGIIAESEDKLLHFIPFSRVVDEGITYKRVKTDISTLDDIRKYFVAQHPSYCGPASAAMILRIFGYKISQDKIGRMAKTIVPGEGSFGGTKPDILIDVVKKLTKGKVIGAWIDSDNISDFKGEIKMWLNNDALIIIDYKKSYLFPSAKKAHYSVCMGINGDELLIVDPSMHTGGVYYVDYKRVRAGMETYSELIGGKRGYIVLAADGTPAFQTLQESLPAYKTRNKKTKSLYKQAFEYYKRVAGIEDIMPRKVRDFLNKANKDEKVARIWDSKK